MKSISLSRFHAAASGTHDFSEMYRNLFPIARKLSHLWARMVNWGRRFRPCKSCQSCGQPWWCPGSSEILLIWLFTLVQLTKLLLYCIVGSHLNIELNHAKLFVVQRIDFFLTWTTIFPVKCKCVKPCNMLMHSLTFYDLCLELNLPDLLAPKHWPFAFTQNRSLSRCLLHTVAQAVLENPVQHFSTERREGRYREMLIPFCPCGSFPSVSPETQRNSQPFTFSKWLACLFGLIWNKRHLTEIQGYSLCVKDITRSLSHSLGVNTEDNGYQHSRLFMLS